MILEEAEETVTTVETDNETYEEIYKVSQSNILRVSYSHNILFLNLKFKDQ